jgi:hypothetical protein
MSPITNGEEPCPNLIEYKGFWFCGDYENRPFECENHNFVARFCPVGLDVLQDKFRSVQDVGFWIDKAYEITKTGDFKK